MIREILEKKCPINPKGLTSLAHKPQYTKGIWWYSLETGEWKLSENPHHNHYSPEFKDIEGKKGWIRGRVLDYQGGIYLIVYLFGNKILSRQLLDIVDKISKSMNIKLDFIVDNDGNDLSNMLEHYEIFSDLGIKRLIC